MTSAPGALPPPPPSPAPPAPVRDAAAPGTGKALAAMILGIVGLALGFLLVPLLCAVVAITLASYAFQEAPRGPGPRPGRSQAVTGLVCGVAALVVWGVVLVSVIATRGA